MEKAGNRKQITGNPIYKKNSERTLNNNGKETGKKTREKRKINVIF